MLSVVVPIYNEEENIPAFHSAIRSVMESMEEHWEVVYVNDGSRDKSLSLLVEIQQRDPRVSRSGIFAQLRPSGGPHCRA